MVRAKIKKASKNLSVNEPVSRYYKIFSLSAIELLLLIWKFYIISSLSKMKQSQKQTF